MWLFKRKNNLGDEELVNNYFQSGDKNLVGILFEKHVTTVYGVCLFYFRDKEIAKDAVMQIFEKIMHELRKTQVKNFKAWLSFVVRNHCISELRKSAGKKYVPETYLDFEVTEPNLEQEEKIATVNEDEMLRHLNNLLPALKENQRLCIELFYLKDKTYQEIAAEKGFTVNEVKSYIQNGKRNLKLLIEAQLNKRNVA